MGVYEVVDVSKRISDVPEWFKGARLNYAENLLKHAEQDKVALYAASKSKAYDADWKLQFVTTVYVNSTYTQCCFFYALNIVIHKSAGQ